MKEKKTIVLCIGTDCPIADTCAFYCPTMDLSKTKHKGVVPYNHEKGKCNFWEEKEEDEPIKN
jgi:hypothetical protein